LVCYQPGEAEVSIPVAANGDCAGLADARLLAQSGADAVMIGRAAMGGPWFVGDVGHFLAHGKVRAEPPPSERLRAALEHFETLLGLFGASQGSHHARKHLAAYGAALLQRLVKLERPGAVKSTMHQLFDSPPALEAA
jgi:tRNA-dihydrouridine synthase B